MKRCRGIIATDHVDSSGERIPVKVLRDMVESSKGSYTLVRVEHDVWRPPIGRGVSAVLCKLVSLQPSAMMASGSGGSWPVAR